DRAGSGADVDETGCGTGGKAAVADSDEVDGPLVDGEPAREARLRVGNGDGVSSGGVGAGGENAGVARADIRAERATRAARIAVPAIRDPVPGSRCIAGGGAGAGRRAVQVPVDVLLGRSVVRRGA